MKLRYLFRMSVDNAMQRNGRMFISVIMYILAMVLIGVIVLLGSIHSNIKGELNDAIRCGIENMGYFSYTLNDENYESFDFYKLSKAMADMDCIDGWTGNWYSGMIDIEGHWSVSNCSQNYELNSLDTIKEIQGANIYNTYEDYSGIESVFISSNAWNMFNIELYMGDEPAACSYNGKYTLMYVGYEYSNIVEPGMIISNGDVSYVIAGILDKDSRMPIDSQELIALSKYSLYSTYLLDYEVLIIDENADEFLNTVSFFTVSKDYTTYEAEQIITSVLEKAGVSITIGWLDDALKNINDKNTGRTYYEILIMMIIISCLVLSCFQINSILSRRKDYGVLFASGMSHRDMIKMVVIENIIKFIVSVIVMFFIISLIINKELRYGLTTIYVIKHILYERLVVVTGMVGILLVFVVSMMPAIIIKRSSLAELIGGK